MKNDFEYLCKSLAERQRFSANPDHGFWTDGDTIFSINEDDANTVADFLEACFGYVMIVSEESDASIPYYSIYPD